MKERFEVRCHNCRAVVDAVSAEWCRCVAKKASIVCPSCGVCWCTAPKQARDAFWYHAPNEVRASVAAERELRAAMNRSAVASAPTVLIVDDDEEIREIAAFTVEQLGYHAVTANDAYDAMDVMQRVNADIVLTDALMPRVDGRELCRVIKKAFAGTKVIIMTSLYTASHYRTEAFRSFKADEYLAKPIDFSRLRTVLTQLAPIAS